MNMRHQKLKIIKKYIYAKMSRKNTIVKMSSRIKSPGLSKVGRYVEEYLKNLLTCDCSHSPFQYNPSGHAITGDLNIIQHESLRKVISHGPKFREPQNINWKHNFNIIMDAAEDYARRWIKTEVDQDPESLSDWVRTIRSDSQTKQFL